MRKKLESRTQVLFVGRFQGYLGIFLGTQLLWNTKLLLGWVGGRPYSSTKGQEPFQIPQNPREVAQPRVRSTQESAESDQAPR